MSRPWTMSAYRILNHTAIGSHASEKAQKDIKVKALVLGKRAQRFCGKGKSLSPSADGRSYVLESYVSKKSIFNIEVKSLLQRKQVRVFSGKDVKAVSSCEVLDVFFLCFVEGEFDGDGPVLELVSQEIEQV